MWPWGHLAFGYVLYSLSVRLWRRRPPGAPGAVLLAVGTQLPDLVDKPLSWTYGVFPQGYGPGHSVLVAVPVGLAVVLLAARRRHAAAGLGLAVGWWSHLVGDVLVALAGGYSHTFDRVLWPVADIPPGGMTVDGVGHVLYFLGEGLERARAPDNEGLVLVYLGFLSGAVLLWLVDGAPGLPRPWRRSRDAGESRPGD